MLKIAIVVGSTRPGRKADTVAQWVYGSAKQRSDAEYEIVDIADFDLPLLDEPIPPSMGKYLHPHTQAWQCRRCARRGAVAPGNGRVEGG